MGRYLHGRQQREQREQQKERMAKSDAWADIEHTIVFVCTSNTCRSPMAEAFAKREVAARLGHLGGGEPGANADHDCWLSERGWRICSAGITEDYEPAGA